MQKTMQTHAAVFRMAETLQEGNFFVFNLLFKLSMMIVSYFHDFKLLIQVVEKCQMSTK